MKSILSGKKLLQVRKIESLQSQLSGCNSDNQDSVIIEKELDLCREELTAEQNSKDKLKLNITMLEVRNRKLAQSLNSAKRDITALEDENQVDLVEDIQDEEIVLDSVIEKKNRQLSILDFFKK